VKEETQHQPMNFLRLLLLIYPINGDALLVNFCISSGQAITIYQSKPMFPLTTFYFHCWLYSGQSASKNDHIMLGSTLRLLYHALTSHFFFFSGFLAYGSTFIWFVVKCKLNIVLEWAMKVKYHQSLSFSTPGHVLHSRSLVQSNCSWVVCSVYFFLPVVILNNSPKSWHIFSKGE
jgi:hypothetical protein